MRYFKHKLMVVREAPISLLTLKSTYSLNHHTSQMHSKIIWKLYKCCRKIKTSPLGVDRSPEAAQLRIREWVLHEIYTVTYTQINQ